MKISTRAVMRQHQRGLRTVDHKARGALRRAGLEEGGNHIVAARTDREDGSDRNVVLEIGGAIQRIDRNAQRRCGVEDFGQFALFGQNGGDGGCGQRAAHHPVGGKIDILLRIAVGIDAAEAAGDAGQRTVGNQVGKLDRGGGDGLDHGGDRGAVGRLRARTIEMRTQCHAFIHGRSPVSALCGAHRNASCRLAVRSPTTSQFAKLVKFSYLWPWQSFPYRGGCRWRAGFCGN